MDGTPRMRSAFPATPQVKRQPRYDDSPAKKRLSEPLPSIPVTKPSPAGSDDPWIPERILDAPSQRLWAFTIWVALWSWRVWDFVYLQEAEEQNLWLFMKWVLLDGIFLFGLPSFRIPWLEWDSLTMTGLFIAHAAINCIMMFQISLPIWAGLVALWRTIWGAYELAVNERNVNPEVVRYNDSLILGRQVINILPEGSAALNPDRETYCLDSTRLDAKLPIRINATEPTLMELMRIDLDTGANETISLGKREIKNMHKEASRLLTYSEKLNEPKTLYYATKRSGIYILQRVVDESSLEVALRKFPHTPVVPCPRAAVLPSTSDRCRGDLSGVELEVVGTPPLRLKYRKMVNYAAQDATFESIQPDDFVSPLSKIAQDALAVPSHIDTFWAKPQKIRVPLSEGLTTGGKWVYSIEEVQDGFGNSMVYTERDHEEGERHKLKSSNLHQVITVHERPTVTLDGCSPQNPIKVAKANSISLPVRFGSSGRGLTGDITYHVEYKFSPQDDISSTGEHGAMAKSKTVTITDTTGGFKVVEPGLYTITDVSSDHCRGDVLEPASCVLLNPPEPVLSLQAEEKFDKCAGSPIGLIVQFDLVGTPPFTINYRSTRKGDKEWTRHTETISGMRSQLELLPKQAGDYVYEFVDISDAVYIGRSLSNRRLTQTVKPAASAFFLNNYQNRVSCIDDQANFRVALNGEGPFSIEYELIHGGKRQRQTKKGIDDNTFTISTDPLRDGGNYTLALISVTDGLGCKEYLKEEARISVRQQRPKVGFGNIDGSRSISTLEGKSVQLPLRLVGKAPWTVRYLDRHGKEKVATAQQQNDRLTVVDEGTYELTDVHDSHCPGVVDEPAKHFDVSWIPRPELRIAPSEDLEQKGNALVKSDICEGDDDAVEILFKGSPPYHVQYAQTVKPQHGAIAPKQKELRAALSVGSLRLESAVAGLYEYRFNKLEDNNYAHNPKHFASATVIQQRVHPRPSVAFTNPGKTYSYCSVESEGEEVIPITLQGVPPFDVDVEIKHHGTGKPETVSLNGITATTHNIRIPHSRIHLGKSAVQLRRVSDSRGCSRLMDSSTPRVQISVHEAPTISPLDSQDDFCVGERINFALSGIAPFTVIYNFEGVTRKAIASSTTFRRLAEKPGNFTIVGLQDSGSQCRANVHIPKRIHGMPSVRVSNGVEKYVDIHEGGETEIVFDFGGVPPFEFTYTRSTNTLKGGKRGTIVDVRSETSDSHRMVILASEEGTYEVVAIKDRYCAYAKQDVKLNTKKLLRN